MSNKVPPSMSGWRSSSQPTCVLLSGVVSWAAMSVCPLLCLIGSLIEQRFSNLSALLIAFVSSSTDRKERREKYPPQSMLDGSLCGKSWPTFRLQTGPHFGLSTRKSEPGCLDRKRFALIDYHRYNLVSFCEKEHVIDGWSGYGFSLFASS